MSPLAFGFMLVSWCLVIGFTVWCFARVLSARDRGAAVEPERGEDG